MRTISLTILGLTLVTISSAAQLKTRGTSDIHATELAHTENTDLNKIYAQIATAVIFGDGQNLNRAQEGVLNNFMASL